MFLDHELFDKVGKGREGELTGEELLRARRKEQQRYGIHRARRFEAGPLDQAGWHAVTRTEVSSPSWNSCTEDLITHLLGMFTTKARKAALSTVSQLGCSGLHVNRGGGFWVVRIQGSTGPPGRGSTSAS